MNYRDSGGSRYKQNLGAVIFYLFPGGARAPKNYGGALHNRVQYDLLGEMVVIT